ncbi:uncharacterized protein METZ01_LOCUS364748, partial [marine metagenome]
EYYAGTAIEGTGVVGNGYPFTTPFSEAWDMRVL